MDAIRLDASTAKALAHPLRMRIVGSLRLDGPATASGLAERLGVSSGLTSYHVRRLADAGFVEPDDAHPASGRERWWRAAHEMTSWRSSDIGDDPDARATDAWLVGHTIHRGMEQLDDWLQRRPDADPAWRDAAESSDYVVELTPDELRAMAAEIDDVILRRRAASLASASPGRQQVVVLLSTFPRSPDLR